MEDQDQKSRFIRKLEVHSEQSQQSANYSSDRFDVLIITISTTALAISIGFSKSLLDQSENTNTGLLKFSWLLFVLSIIGNLLSQLSSLYSHRYDIKATRNIIREARGKTMQGNQSRNIKISAYLDNLTEGLNVSSLIALIAGIITIVIFFSKNI